MDGEKDFKDVDGYIASFPKDAQKRLGEIRKAIKESAPDAQESIGYKMPSYKLNGILVYFAGYKRHVGFYPMPSAIKKFEDTLARYKVSKGGVQFPLDEPIPVDLVKEMVRFRVEENASKAKRKGKSY